MLAHRDRIFSCSKRLSWPMLVALGAIFVILPGCGGAGPSPAPPTANSLKGAISLDGAVIKVGVVRVLCEDGETREGLINEDGTYVVENLHLGKARLAVVPPPDIKLGNGKFKKGKFKEEVREIAPELLEIHASILEMPKRFSSLENSGLEFTISEGQSTFDIKLTK